jgi:hypothetical protein
MNVKFCATCRGLLLADFRYCPYCGNPASKGPDLAEAVDAPFARLAAASGEKRIEGRFLDLAERLDRLEEEMDQILSQGRLRRP